ncbi:hypothetical protein F4809DRAFT_43688 [Biscogniauxia mediterranea]|nr:hypothetical protein F4809DRAFT_43688 [Biscogniauxia mediterranea]
MSLPLLPVQVCIVPRSSLDLTYRLIIFLLGFPLFHIRTLAADRKVEGGGQSKQRSLGFLHHQQPLRKPTARLVSHSTKPSSLGRLSEFAQGARYIGSRLACPVPSEGGRPLRIL